MSVEEENSETHAEPDTVAQVAPPKAVKAEDNSEDHNARISKHEVAISEIDNSTDIKVCEQ